MFACFTFIYADRPSMKLKRKWPKKHLLDWNYSLRHKMWHVWKQKHFQSRTNDQNPLFSAYSNQETSIFSVLKWALMQFEHLDSLAATSSDANSVLIMIILIITVNNTLLGIFAGGNYHIVRSFSSQSVVFGGSNYGKWVKNNEPDLILSH